mgnify:CR=1 FL=1
MAWFKEWFNSPYYHLLYGKRDENEAGMFIHNLVDYLRPPVGSTMLDLACGKGRHSRILSELGFDVTGLDLSDNSIAEARKYTTDKLHFDVHDMRKPYRTNAFNYVFNLFTSFGYFENEEDNIRVLQSVHDGLREGGLLIQDYFNAEKVHEHFRQDETKLVRDICFSIHKEVVGERIIKTIAFDDKGKHCVFQEKVSLYGLDDFRDMYSQSGFEILAVFGDYNLGKFDKNVSDRLILISQKK